MIGITGHQGLPAAVSAAVDQRIRRRLDELDAAVWGVTCLAGGADQIFAQAVLDFGGRIGVIVPAAEYRDGLDASARATYDDLFSQAATVHRLSYVESSEQAHMDASAAMLDQVRELWAVWDGKPARGFGGTADVVALARERGIPVVVIWPAGASRDL